MKPMPQCISFEDSWETRARLSHWGQLTSVVRISIQIDSFWGKMDPWFSFFNETSVDYLIETSDHSGFMIPASDSYNRPTFFVNVVDSWNLLVCNLVLSHHNSCRTLPLHYMIHHYGIESKLFFSVAQHYHQPARYVVYSYTKAADAVALSATEFRVSKRRPGSYTKTAGLSVRVY